MTQPTGWTTPILWSLATLSGLAPGGGAQELSRLEKLEKRVAQLEAGKGSPLAVTWDKGFRFTSADGNFKLKFGGRIQVDFAWMAEDDDLRAGGADLEDGVEFRRTRLYVSGTIYQNYIFKAQYDFAGGDADFKDVWLGLKKIPVLGTVKIGHYKEPFSLEQLTSSKYISLMERALSDAFAPGRGTGIMVTDTVKDAEDRVSWAIGLFQDSNGYGDNKGDTESVWNVTARVTGLPLYEEKGKRLLHVGLAASYRDPENGEVRYRTRPEAHMTDTRLVDTGGGSLTDSDSVLLLGLESALVYDSFSAQAEYMHAMVDSSAQDDPAFDGFYITGRYFLTGEHRRYKTNGAIFDRIKPKQNFDLEGGSGAWEVALRYSAIDLDDGNVDGGEEWNLAAGLNWYLNPNVRVTVNYIYADVADSPAAGNTDGSANIFQMRFQIDF